jgi:hypothetical protein
MAKRLPGMFTRWMILVALCCLAVTDPVPGSAQDSSLINRSSIIFVGTVVRLHAVSFRAVPASKKTAVVRVDRVIEKPGTVALTAGHEITVELKEPAKFKEGSSATFYAQGWILGQGIAVREVGHEASTPAAAASTGQIGARVAQARQQLSDADLRARLSGADMVVVGRVSAVRKAAVSAGGRKFITEHDPDWQEATIRVESAMKGARAGDEVVLRFPGSNDVMYRNAPKFKADQEGVFIMKKDSVTGLPRLMVGTTQVDAYVVHRSSTLLPKADSSRVKQLLKPR